jgi:hypothetical protein
VAPTPAVSLDRARRQPARGDPRRHARGASRTGGATSCTAPPATARRRSWRRRPGRWDCRWRP